MGPLNKDRELELAFLKNKQEFQAGHAKKRETSKLPNMIKTLGCSTIQSIANASPNLQKSLLQSLGITNTSDICLLVNEFDNKL